MGGMFKPKMPKMPPPQKIEMPEVKELPVAVKTDPGIEARAKRRRQMARAGSRRRNILAAGRRPQQPSTPTSNIGSSGKKLGA